VKDKVKEKGAKTGEGLKGGFPFWNLQTELLGEDIMWGKTCKKVRRKEKKRTDSSRERRDRMGIGRLNN